MNDFDIWWILLFANLAIVSLIWLAIVWLAAQLPRRLPFKSGLISTGLSIALLLPVIVGSSQVLGWGQLAWQRPVLESTKATSQSPTTSSVSNRHASTQSHAHQQIEVWEQDTETIMATESLGLPPTHSTLRPASGRHAPTRNAESTSLATLPSGGSGTDESRSSVTSLSTWLRPGGPGIFIATVLIGCWCVGIVITLSHKFRELQTVRQLLADACPASKELQHWIRELDLPYPAPVLNRLSRSVLTSNRISVPLVSGWLRHKLILPENNRHTYEDDQLRAMLVHEWTHCERRDPWWQLIAQLVKSLYWWNPLTYRLANGLSEIRELVCDDSVVSVVEHPESYARLILELAEQHWLPTKQSSALSAVSLSMATPTSSLENRIRRILDPKTDSRSRFLARRDWAVLAGVLVLGIAGSAVAQVKLIPVNSEIPGKAPTTTPFYQEAEEGVEELPTAELGTAGQPGETTHPFVFQMLAPSGHPVPGAKVEVRLRDAVSDVTTDNEGQCKVIIHARDNGTIQFANMLVTSSDETLKSYFGNLQQFSQQPVHRLTLSPPTSRSVRVLDSKNTPVPEASVVVSLGSNPGGFSEIYFRGETGKDGEVQFAVPQEAPILWSVAWSNAHGLDYRSYARKSRRNSDVSWTPQSFPDAEPETLKFTGAKPLTVTLVDQDQRPIPGIKIDPAFLQRPDQDMQLFLFPLELEQTTDSNGQITFPWFPNWQDDVFQVLLEVDGYQLAPQLVRSERITSGNRGYYDPTSDSGQLILALQKLSTLKGQITTPDGLPATDIQVRFAARSFRSRETSTRTDQQGRYELHVPPDAELAVAVGNRDWGTAQKTIRMRPESTEQTLNFEVSPTTLVRIHFRDSGSEYPEAGYVHPVVAKRYTQALSVDLDTLSVPTDEAGIAEYHLGPGRYYLSREFEFTVTDETELDIRFPVPAPPTTKLNGVVTIDGKPIPGAKLFLIENNFRRHEAVTDTAGRFTLKLEGKTGVLQAASPDGKWIAKKKIQPGENSDLEISLNRAATAVGKLLDQQGRALANQRVSFQATGGPVVDTVTDDSGKFQATLVPNVLFRIYHIQDPRFQNQLLQSDLRLNPGENKDLGQLKLVN